MKTKFYLLLVLVFAGSLAIDHIDKEQESVFYREWCNSACPDGDEVKLCCKDHGYLKGYCDAQGRAECEEIDESARSVIQQRVSYSRQYKAHEAHGVPVGV